MIHYTEQYFLNPQHKITVNLIGLGGTGSQVLTGLARLNETLVGLDHPGLHVYAYDGDTVSESNIGRQMFSPADLGHNKAVTLVTRINRYFGYNWEAFPFHCEGANMSHISNLTITCVDTAAARIAISKRLKGPSSSNDPMHKGYYWLDFGNLKKTGQVVLGTLRTINAPKGSGKDAVPFLKTVVELFPELKKIKEKDTGPSCSLAQALGKQDLYVNSTLAQLGCNILWKMFREGKLSYHGCYMNLDTMVVNPIKISQRAAIG